MVNGRGQIFASLLLGHALAGLPPPALSHKAAEKGVSTMSLIPLGPEGLLGEWPAPDGVTWISATIINPVAEKLWSRRHPGKRWPYTHYGPEYKMDPERLKRLRVRVTSHRTPARPGKIRALRIGRVWFHHPDDLREHSLRRAWPVMEGVFKIPGELFQEAGTGLFYYTIAHIYRLEHPQEFPPGSPAPEPRSKEVMSCRSRWRLWARQSCPEQDPDVNGGLVKGAFARSAETGRVVELWLQQHADPIIERRLKPEARRKVPWVPGYWLSEETWHDDEYGECLTEERIAAFTAEAGDRMSRPQISKLRRTSHPALDGAPRWRRLPPLKVPEQGEGPVYVISREDWSRILRWRREHKEAAGRPPDGWESTTGMRRRYGVRNRADQFNMTFALKRFKAECPEGVKKIPGWNEKGNQGTDRTYYDPATFERWRAGRSLEELAAPQREADAPAAQARAGARLHRAIRFLQFVLTYRTYRTKRGVPWFPAAAFRRFLHAPPVGKTLRPGPTPLAASLIKKWAKRLKISVACSRTLDQAKWELEVEHSPAAPGRPSYWRLPGPITIKASVFDLPRENGRGHTDRRSGQARGNERVPTDRLDGNRVGRPEVNADLVAFAREQQEANPELKCKDILRLWWDRHPEHPIFSAAKPAAALRAALSRARQG